MQHEWTVPDAHSGVRLINFIKDSLADNAPSLKQIKRWIDSGMCFVNQKCERFASRQVVVHDLIQLTVPQTAKREMIFKPEDILYEDESLFIYNKPSGFLCDQKHVLQFFKREDLELIHRLDKDTTGVLLFSKDKKIKEAFITLFRQGQIEKEYLAIVDGGMLLKKGSVTKGLKPQQKYQGQTIWTTTTDRSGLTARTDWENLAKTKYATLVRLSPTTGRTHQIRVHMSSLGHPLLGDRQYGGMKSALGAGVLETWTFFLHASKIKFMHPVTKKWILVSAPAPQAFTEAVERIFGPAVCDILL